MQKWYLPQELYSEYRLNQWSYTNYARDFYLRYLQPDLEGDYFYDLFGRRVMHGWLIYEARKEQPRASEGNSLLKSPLYGNNFQNLIISSDAKGQYRYALTIGNEMRTTLTPMTFNKAVFNGIQFDYLADRYAGTILLSRVSAPLVATSDFGVGLTNATELKAGRATVQVGDHVTLGGTYVNTHNSRATLERFSGNMFKGFLTTDQAANAVSSWKSASVTIRPKTARVGPFSSPRTPSSRMSPATPGKAPKSVIPQCERVASCAMGSPWPTATSA